MISRLAIAAVVLFSASANAQVSIYTYGNQSTIVPWAIQTPTPHVPNYVPPAYATPPYVAPILKFTPYELPLTKCVTNGNTTTCI